MNEKGKRYSIMEKDKHLEDLIRLRKELRLNHMKYMDIAKDLENLIWKMDHKIKEIGEMNGKREDII